MNCHLPLPIELWLWPLTGSDRREALAAHLSEDERARAARFVKPQDAQSWTIARGRLREILGEYLGQAPGALEFDYSSYGRPTLRAAPDLSFSLSHSGGFAALAVAPSTMLGLDIEAPRQIELSVARHFFTQLEQDELARLPKSEQLTGFYNCWTRKEAMIKAFGLGLSMPLRSFAVSLTPHARSALRELTGGIASEWEICHLTPHPSLVGALAVKTNGQRLRLIPRAGWPQ